MSEITATPSLPAKMKDNFFQESRDPRFWTLYYRYSNIPQITKGFKLDGSMKDAIKRAQDHCKTMGYHFICVRPLIVDLDHQEKMFNEAQAKEDGREDDFR